MIQLACCHSGNERRPCPAVAGEAELATPKGEGARITAARARIGNPVSMPRFRPGEGPEAARLCTCTECGTYLPHLRHKK